MTAGSELPALQYGDVERLVDALDALEYWQVGADLPRHDGMVWLPGDSIDAVDRFEMTESPPSKSESRSTRCALFVAWLTA